MPSNSSSLVISFSIAILLLLILLLLLSYNSKNKRDNTEKFNNNFENITSLGTNPIGTFTDIMNTLSSSNNKENKKEGFYAPDTSMASFDPYARSSSITNPNMGYEPNDENVGNFSSLNGNDEEAKKKFSGIKEGFETQMVNDPTTCLKKEKLTSQDLLPKDAQNLKWANINPSSQANIEDQNFLTAGYHIGVNTVGQSLRNANLQLRSEIPNPQVAVSPWLISTIEPDVRATTLEIGSAPSY